MTCTTSIAATLATIDTWHVVVFLVVVLLLFGGKKLPELARGLAKGLRIFRDELHGTQQDVEDTLTNPPPKTDKEKTPTPPGEEKKP